MQKFARQDGLNDFRDSGFTEKQAETLAEKHVALLNANPAALSSPGEGG